MSITLQSGQIMTSIINFNMAISLLVLHCLCITVRISTNNNLQWMFNYHTQMTTHTNNVPSTTCYQTLASFPGSPSCFLTFSHLCEYYMRKIEGEGEHCMEPCLPVATLPWSWRPHSPLLTIPLSHCFVDRDNFASRLKRLQSRLVQN